MLISYMNERFDLWRGDSLLVGVSAPLSTLHVRWKYRIRVLFVTKFIQPELLRGARGGTRRALEV